MASALLSELRGGYVMKQKLFCWGDDFTIKTPDGQDVLIEEIAQMPIDGAG
jgi:uncharacterized protein YxjI